MAVTVTKLSCPQCGGSITIDQKVCEYCDAPILISTFNTVDSIPLPQIGKHIASYRQALAEEPDNKDMNIAVAMCFLKLKQYTFALDAFEKAMPYNFDNSEVFFYAAVCLLQGKIPFLHLRPTIDKILSYMESALMLEQRGIYYYFLAYIKLDYFKRKFLNTTPNYQQLLAQAHQCGVSDYDIQQLFALLGTPRPVGL